MPTLFYRLFLDDERIPAMVTWVDLPPDPWMVVRSYDAFVSHIETHGVPDFIAFDHDLGIAPRTPQSDIDLDNAIINRGVHRQADYTVLPAKTGYHCAMWLAEKCLTEGLPFPEYVVHSMNPVGRENIRSVMESAIRLQKSVKDETR